ncbi:MAG: aryl-sulfate sulfotransferase [Bryobacteraceae bacterium]|nr:aryl-sulfate sulfotransferase [Bryobacteraceae bacterium]
MRTHIVLWAAIAAIPASAAISVSLDHTGPAHRGVGELIGWSAAVSGTNNPVFFRFRARIPGELEFRTIQDFGTESRIDWTFSEYEGPLDMEATAMDRVTGEQASAIVSVQLLSRAVGGAVVNATAHPLVKLYSAPACADAGRIRVQVSRDGQPAFATPWKDCSPWHSMNFLLAGMRASTAYRAVHEVERNGEIVRSGEGVEFVTGEASGQYIEHNSPDPLSGPQSILLSAPLFPNRPTATDAEGRLIWYYPGSVSLLTRTQNGKFWGLIQSPGSKAMQKIREFDLTGMTLRETNAERVNDHITPHGHTPISGFHHEVFELPDGRILALASAEHLTTGLQGDGEVNILSDVILVMDRDLNVIWHWDGFDYLDPRRKAILDEKCSIGACPPLFLTADANDWTHANSVQLTPDGHFLISVRHLDNLLKINYSNGSGDGVVLWEFGKDGHFQLEGGNADDWFSHQHDAQMLDERTLLLFDNSNTRYQTNRSATSRGQVFQLDETARTARLLLNVDLGVYSFALGSAQRLESGAYYFGIGWLLPDNLARGVEVDANGREVGTSTLSRPAYRSFRLRDLYTTP